MVVGLAGIMSHCKALQEPMVGFLVWIVKANIAIASSAREHLVRIRSEHKCLLSARIGIGNVNLHCDAMNRLPTLVCA